MEKRLQDSTQHFQTRQITNSIKIKYNLSFVFNLQLNCTSTIGSSNNTNTVNKEILYMYYIIIRTNSGTASKLKYVKYA